MQDYAARDSALYEITGKKAFIWNDAQEFAFKDSKGALPLPPVLCFPNNNDSFVLVIDVSNIAIDCVLYQVQDGKKRVIVQVKNSVMPATTTILYNT